MESSGVWGDSLFQTNSVIQTRFLSYWMYLTLKGIAKN